jgi:hypothetical protein
MATPNLAIVHIAAAQNQPEVTANGAFDALDAAMNLEVQISMTDADATLTQAQLASGGAIVMNGALTGDRNINLPVSMNRSFLFQNGTTGGHNLTVQVTGAPGTTVTIAAADGLVELYTNGTDVSQISGAIASGGGGGGGGGGTVPSFADQETPTGTIDGSNTAFTLAFAPSPAASLILVQSSGAGGGSVLKAGGVDFTLSGTSLTMTNPPPTGDSLLAWYRH